MGIEMKGFSLIECMIYCAVASYMLMMIAPCAVGIVDRCKKVAQQHLQLVAQQSGIDVMNRLFQSMPASREQWQSMQSHNPIWFDEYHDHHKSLLIKENNLYLRYGQYDPKKQRWSHYKTTKIMHDVTQLTTDYITKNDSISAISYTLVQCDTVHNGLIRLHNRIIPCT